MVCLEDDSASSALETPAFIEQYEAGVSKRVPRFVAEFSIHSEETCKPRKTTDCIAAPRFASRYIFETNIPKRYRKSFTQYKDVTTRSTRKPMKHDVFRRGLVRDGNAKRGGYSTLYLRIQWKCFERRSNLGKGDITFCPQYGKAS